MSDEVTRSMTFYVLRFMLTHHRSLPLGAEAQRACAWEEARCFSGFSPMLAQTFDLYYNSL